MNGKKSTEELKELWSFLKTYYGIPTSISIFFPLSGRIVPYIVGTWPYKGGFGRFPPDLVMYFAMIITTFFIFWTFGQRDKEKDWMKNEAWRSFFKGLLVLVIYIFATFAIIDDIYFRAFNIQSGSLLWNIGDTFLLILYSYFFAMLTRAFMLLGMIEFYKTNSDHRN